MASDGWRARGGHSSSRAQRTGSGRGARETGRRASADSRLTPVARVHTHTEPASTGHGLIPIHVAANYKCAICYVLEHGIGNFNLAFIVSVSLIHSLHLYTPQINDYFLRGTLNLFCYLSTRELFAIFTIFSSLMFISLSDFFTPRPTGGLILAPSYLRNYWADFFN